MEGNGDITELALKLVKIACLADVELLMSGGAAGATGVWGFVLGDFCARGGMFSRDAMPIRNLMMGHHLRVSHLVIACVYRVIETDDGLAGHPIIAGCASRYCI